MSEIIQTAEQLLLRYNPLANKALDGDYAPVAFRAAQSDADGTYDANALNRKRLTALMRALRTELIRADIVETLFRAETQSCLHNSFGGYDTVLTTLAAMLWQFNGDGRYDGLLEEAKHANFDCECGFSTERGYYRYQTGLEYLDSMTPAECVSHMYFDMGLTEGILPLLNRVEEEYAEDIDELSKIRTLNEALGRKQHNERYYRLRVSRALAEADEWELASGYLSLTGCLIDDDPEGAFVSFTEGLQYLFHERDWSIYNLGRDYIGFAARFILLMPQRRETLWAEWAPHIRKGRKEPRIGDECTEAYRLMKQK